MMKLGIASLRLIAILWLASCAFVRAADPGTANSATTSIQTAYLEFQQLDYSLMNLGLSIEPQSTPFKKEPDFQQRQVFRGFLHYGKDKIPFVWDNVKGKLYLDSNFDGDLTNDPKSVYTTLKELGTGTYQTFTNVLFDFKVLDGPHQLQVDVHLYHSGNRVNGYALLKSLWTGKLTLGGQEWQLGVHESIYNDRAISTPSHLLLRPWKDRGQTVSFQDGSLEGFPFAPTLFFQNRSYQLTCTYESTGDRPRYKVEFKEQPAKLGEVNFTGKFVDRMTLEGTNSIAVLDTPGPTFKVPVGNYRQVNVVLKQGATKAAASLSRSPISQTSLAVTENKPAVLTAGGPLTNSVTTHRRGKILTLNYQLLGANGELYQILRGNRGEPPVFAIYQGDKRIHSGKFEFG